MKVAATVILGLLLCGCAGSRNPSEAAWQRGQCEQIVEDKLRQKCIERVEREHGR